MSEDVDSVIEEVSTEALDAAVAEGLGEAASGSEPRAEPGGSADPAIDARSGESPFAPPELQPAQSPSATVGDANLESILEIPVTLSIEIGRSRMTIRELLQLNQGSVVELDRLAGEPIDVLVNGTLVAHGEVVVINEKFGIRLTDVISASERVRKLG